MPHSRASAAEYPSNSTRPKDSGSWNDGPGDQQSNVLAFALDCGSVIVRPSGTEPKIKIYFTTYSDSAARSLEISEALQAEMEKYL